MFENITNNIIVYLNKGVTAINNILSTATGNNAIIVVMVMAVALGFILKRKFGDDNKMEIHWWALFSLMIYMSLRFLGIGG